MKTKNYIITILLIIAGTFCAKAQSNAITSADTTIYTEVDKKPEFIGGEYKLYTFLARVTKYPSEAREKRIQGRVVLSFVVETDGRLSDIKIAKSLSPDMDAEALRVFSKSPKWSPGIKDGKPVRTLHRQPFNFTLAND